jgi:hypothetical protein
MDDQGIVVRFLEGSRDISYSKWYRPEMEPAQPPIQFIPEVFLGGKGGRVVKLTIYLQVPR